MDAPPEPELDPVVPVGRARARRGVALIAAALVVIAAAGVAYVHPSLPVSRQAAPPAVVAPPQAGYTVAAVDFVEPATGWVVALFDDGDFLVMRTADAARHWTPQLSGPSGGHGVYLKFFDASDGVFALVGGRPLLYRTTDGGATWSAQAAVTAQATVLAWSFTDPARGWMLVHVDPQVADDTHLYRTSDAGQRWADLGRPVKAPDQAFGVTFVAGGTGWLATLSSGPYAYRSDDYGLTWERVALPSAHGWPARSQFLVSTQPTGLSGVVASVVSFPPTSGRSGIGATILDYPPLKVRAFDGGVPVVYIYGIATDTFTYFQRTLWSTNTALQVQAPDQAQLVSVDGGSTWSPVTLPAGPGAIGVLDPWHWWWIGPGSSLSTVDAGRTWSTPRAAVVPQPLAGSLEVLDTRDAWYAAMVGSRPVLVLTSDGGRTWRSVQLPPMSSRFTP